MFQSLFAHALRSRFGAFVCAAALALAAGAHAASGPSVPYVPTPQNVVERMLELAKVGPQDYLIDLGSGDGRIVVTAARKHGARGFGVDLNPTRISEANANAREAGVTGRVAFYQQDLFETDLGQATVITMYLLPSVNLELRPKLLDLKPGTRIVSHDFSMGDWKPEHHERLDAQGKYGGAAGLSDVYLWIVPAKVAGTWRSQLTVRGKPVDYEFTLDQEYQMVSGTARVAGRTVKLANARVNGAELAFDFTVELDGAPIRHAFSGRMDGTELAGTVDLAGARLQARLGWSARRAGARAIEHSALISSATN